MHFNWEPSLTTIKNFFEHKTYVWAWELIDTIPIEKVNTEKKQVGLYDEYKDIIVEGLEDPYFGSNENNFYEYLKTFAPELNITDRLFFYLRKKFGICPQSKQRSDKIIARINENKELEIPLLYEMLNKEFGLNFSMFNYYCRKANLCKALTEKGYKKFCNKRKASTLSVKFEMRYSLEGKFYVEEIKLPKNLVESSKNKFWRSSRN